MPTYKDPLEEELEKQKKKLREEKLMKMREEAAQASERAKTLNSVPGLIITAGGLTMEKIKNAIRRRLNK